MIISLDAEKAFDKNPTSLYNKNHEEIRGTRDILQHNKGNLQQSHSQHQLKWRETQSNSATVRNNVASFSIPTEIKVFADDMVVYISGPKNSLGNSYR